MKRKAVIKTSSRRSYAAYPAMIDRRYGTHIKNTANDPLNSRFQSPKARAAQRWQAGQEQMTTIKPPGKTALIVVDAQIGVMRDAWDADRIIKNIAHAVERARTQLVPVIWVQHADDELAHASPDWHLVPALIPADGETLIHKHFNSAFEQTGLHETLATLGITHIVLAGAATNWCIRATAYGALERGYDLTLIEDAHTTGAIELPNGQTIEAETIIQELNIAMKWVNYPDRSNRTAPAARIDFTTQPSPIAQHP